jgi:hypothetical protein
MSWPAVAAAALALAVVAAAVVTVSASERRLALVGLAASLSLAPLVADPLPDPLVIAIRIVGAALAAYLVRIPLRDAGPGRGSRIGWPAEATAAAAAFLAGLAASSTGLAGDGPAAATAAAFAVGVVVVVPLADQRDPGRTGLALLLAILAADLLRVGLGDPGTPGSLTIAAAMVAVATAVAAMLVAREERHHGSGRTVPIAAPEDEP